MATIARSEDSLCAALAPSEARRVPEAMGFAASALLHGLVLLWLLIAAPFGSYGSGGVRFVPIDVVFETAPAKTPPPQPQAATAPALGAPQAQASNPANAAPSPAASPTAAGAGPIQAQPPADALEAKLEALAQLRQPETTQSISAEVPTSDDGAGGRAGPPGLKDSSAPRSSVAGIESGEFGQQRSLRPDRSQDHGQGRHPQGRDRGERPLRRPGLSRGGRQRARNAVLLASPIALPAGHYQDVMEMVLNLNPRDTLH